MISRLQGIFGAEKDVLRFPERLRLDKIDPMFRLVAKALLRIELALHGRLLTHFQQGSEHSRKQAFRMRF
jgi:hypothetical protein